MERFHQVKDTLLGLCPESIQKGLFGVGHYALKTGKQFVYQCCLIPSALFSIFSHPNTRRIPKDALIISITNALPILILNYTKDKIQKNNPIWDSYTEILYVYGTVSLIAAVSFIYYKSPMAVRNGVLTISAGRTIRKLPPKKTLTLCLEVHCSCIRFLQGEVRDYIVYYSTEAFIFALSFLPILGMPLSLILGIPHRGRYILSNELTDLCQRHQVAYLTEYSEIALALGLVHLMMTYVFAHYLESYSGLPSSYSLQIFMPLMIPFAFVIAKHMDLPPPVVQSHRRIIDPLFYFQWLAGKFFDIFSLGLKKKIEKEPKIALSPATVPKTLLFIQKVENLHPHPWVEFILNYGAPKMFQSKNQFLGDAIIKPNWMELRSSILKSIDSLFVIRKDIRVRMLLLAPDAFFKYGLHLYFDIPPALVGLTLQSFRNKDLMMKLHHFRSFIDGLDFDDEGQLKGFWGEFEILPSSDNQEEEDDFEEISADVSISVPQGSCEIASYEERLKTIEKASFEQTLEWKQDQVLAFGEPNSKMPQLVDSYDKFKATIVDPGSKMPKTRHRNPPSSYTKVMQLTNKALAIAKHLPVGLMKQDKNKENKEEIINRKSPLQNQSSQSLFLKTAEVGHGFEMK